MVKTKIYNFNPEKLLIVNIILEANGSLMDVEVAVRSLNLKPEDHDINQPKHKNQATSPNIPSPEPSIVADDSVVHFLQLHLVICRFIN